MAKLPFVVQPRLAPIKELLGSEESGKIEIERRGYLSVSEKATVQNAMSDDTAMAELYALAGKIARETGKSPQDALKGIMERDEGFEEYENEISKILMEVMRYQEVQKIVQATALLSSRVNPKWNATDTLSLHPDLLDDLCSLYEDEERKSIEALEKISEETAQDSEQASESSSLKE